VIDRQQSERILKILRENPEVLGSGVNIDDLVDKESIDTVIARLYNSEPSGVMATLVNPNA